MHTTENSQANQGLQLNVVPILDEHPITSRFESSYYNKSVSLMSENTHRDSILNTEVNVYNSIEERKLMNTQKVQLLSFVKPNLAFASKFWN